MKSHLHAMLVTILLGAAPFLPAQVDPIEQVIIIGGGPAGYTAALYAARADLKPLVIEGAAWGGQLMTTTDVENYPGYPEGVSGPQMIQDFRRQAERFGARFLPEDATALQTGAPGQPHLIKVGAATKAARAVILAMGAQYRKLDVPGEADLAGRGVSYCATCDGPFFRDQRVLVVGGGDSAMEEALFLTRIAKEVTIVHRRPDFRASRIMLARAQANPKIRWRTPFAVQSFQPGSGGALEKVVLRSLLTGALEPVEARGAFVAIGQVPNSDWVREVVPVDGKGYVQTEGGSTRTRVPGIFAAGDLVDHTYRQATTAAGTGCMAALDAERYLRDTAP